LANILSEMNNYNITKLPRHVLKSTASKLRVLRKQNKYSQAELADRSGVSLGSLKRFETTGQISLESFLKLLHVLDRLEEFDTILKPGEDLKAIEKLFSFSKNK
jgi:transcriptional regulator with XRE-family HTH domain